MARSAQAKSAGKKVKDKVRAAADVILDNLAGRPSAWHDGFIHLVSQMTLVGANQTQVARLLGVAHDTISAWMRDKPGFSEAIKQARENADLEVEDALRKRALGFEHASEKIFCTKDGDIVRANCTVKYPPDSTAALFWLKNRHPVRWREQVAPDGPTPEDAKRLLREELKELDEAIQQP